MDVPGQPRIFPRRLAEMHWSWPFRSPALVNLIRRSKALPSTFRILRLRFGAAQVGKDVRVIGPLKLRGPGSVVLGDRVVVISSDRANSLEARGPTLIRTLSPAASIVVGNDTGISSASISAIRRIVIGQGVLVGSGCIITDTDHHYVEVPEGIRRRYAGIPEGRHDDEVFISDDVFLGARTIVLKGVRIGQGAVIGAGSVVSRDVPEYVLAAGNPCRIVGRVE